VEPNPNIALFPPYPAAAKPNLAVPAVLVSVETLPKTLTKLVTELVAPKPNIALVSENGVLYIVPSAYTIPFADKDTGIFYSLRTITCCC